MILSLMEFTPRSTIERSSFPCWFGVRVVRTKSTKDLPLPMAIATVFNSACWFGFGSLVVHDAYVWAPNIIGVASGITQLALIAKYGIYRGDGDVKES